MARTRKVTGKASPGASAALDAATGRGPERPDPLALLIGCKVTAAFVREDTLFLTLAKPGVWLHAFVSRDPEDNGPGTLHVYDAAQKDRLVALVGGR